MRIASLRIRGFRSLRDVEIPMGPLTVLIGPNGSGKSSALTALRLFLQPRIAVTDQDFWQGSEAETADEIRIEATLTELSPEEREVYEDFVALEGHLKVERVFLEAGTGAFVATVLGRPEFEEVRTAQLGHRDNFNALVDGGTFPELERARNKDDAFEKMREWERNNPGECEPIAQEVDFPLLPEPEPRALRRRMKLAFIGALEDPETHVGTQRGGAMAELLDSLTDFSDLTEEMVRATDEAAGKIATALSRRSEEFDEIMTVVEAAMARFARGFTVDLAWSTPQLPVPPIPEISVSIIDADGLSLGLARQGHGIQRSLMFGLLTAQAELGVPDLPRIIVVAIEEPEAFQHPLSARALTRTFETLSQDSHQIIYSTHSPDLVPARAVTGMRLFARGPSEDNLGKEATVKVFALDNLRARLEMATGRTDFTDDSTLARLRANLDSRVLEGIFAKLVVLVEGEEDEALIRGGAAHLGWDLDDAGVSVVQSRGKTSMPLLVAFFVEVGVATYPVFDLDRHLPEEQRFGGALAEASITSLLSATSEEGLEETTISNVLACWHEDFGRQVRSEIGETFTAAEEAVCQELGYPLRQGRKVGPVVQAVLDRCYSAGSRSDSLDRLLETIRRRLDSR